MISPFYKYNKRVKKSEGKTKIQTTQEMNSRMNGDKGCTEKKMVPMTGF